MGQVCIEDHDVNSMIEADSYRKCRSAHKGVANFSCILFPEILSADGETTLYYAPVHHKEYGDYMTDVGWDIP